MTPPAVTDGTGAPHDLWKGVFQMYVERIQRTLFSVLMSLILALTFAGFSPVDADDMTAARTAVTEAMTQVGMAKNDNGILLLTNAFYGQVNGKGAEPYRDLLSEITGCTTGKRTLLDVHTPFYETLWFSFFRKKDNKLVFCKWQDNGFQSQTIDARPEALLNPAAWKKASSGLIGKKNLFQVVSIGSAWASGADWPLMKSASFHDHLCPGVNVGYLMQVYLTKNLPLEKGDQYRFFGALPKCYMDTLQVLFNATLGKQASYGITMTKEQLSKYKEGAAVPCVIALKVNKKKDTCRGVVFGFSWKQIMDDLGLSMADFAPKKGPADPVFFVTRVKACSKMAQIKLEDKMKWLVKMKTFSGDASLASAVCHANGDPYAVVWAK